MLAAAAELVFPTRCAGCEAPGALLCPACIASLPTIDPVSACPRCGAPAAGGCRECRDSPFGFSGARCFGLLAPPLSRAVTLYKDGGERRLAPVFAAMLAAAVGDWREWADGIVPVPASPLAIRKRGFDHVDAIARHLARELDLPLLHPLARERGRDQRQLGRQARRENVSRAFRLHSGEVPRRLLLVDDVFTTGATLDAAARTLLTRAQEVRVVALSRAANLAPSSTCGSPSTWT